jgi:RNA polymerase sigma-54 factor
MNLELNMAQSQQTSQVLNLAPQLLQWLRLLQAPTVELAAIVQHELETNPALELDDGAGEGVEEKIKEVNDNFETNKLDFSDNELGKKLEVLSEMDEEWAMEGSRVDYSAMEESQEKHDYALNSIKAQESLQQHLLQQLEMVDKNVSGELQNVCKIVIGSLDRRGFLTLSGKEIAELADVGEEIVLKAIRTVQSFEPAGIAVKDLKESLLLQLERKGLKHHIAYQMLEEHSGYIESRNYKALADLLDVNEEDVVEAIKLLSTLNPDPAADFAYEPIEYISPDIMVRKAGDDYVVELNHAALPQLKVSEKCKEMVEKPENVSSSDLSYLRRKIRQASFLIEGISQRQETLLKVAYEIVRIQKKYFDTEEENELVPLTMNKIAQIIGVHETTVSRAIANKYILTPFGLKPMKSFFKGGYVCADGSSITPDNIKEMIEKFVAEENPSSPLTDLQITKLFKEKGLNVARRTVAKYREELSIPSSKERVSSAKNTISNKISTHQAVQIKQAETSSAFQEVVLTDEVNAIAK